MRLKFKNIKNTKIINIFYEDRSFEYSKNVISSTHKMKE